MYERVGTKRGSRIAECTFAFMWCDLLPLRLTCRTKRQAYCRSEFHEESVTHSGNYGQKTRHGRHLDVLPVLSCVDHQAESASFHCCRVTLATAKVHNEIAPHGVSLMLCSLGQMRDSRISHRTRVVAGGVAETKRDRKVVVSKSAPFYYFTVSACVYTNVAHSYDVFSLLRRSFSSTCMISIQRLDVVLGSICQNDPGAEFFELLRPLLHPQSSDTFSISAVFDGLVPVLGCAIFKIGPPDTVLSQAPKAF